MSSKEIFIPIIHDAGAQYEVIREISAGLEEEGVPYRVLQRTTRNLGDLPSPLQVVIGVHDNGTVSVSHEKVKGTPYLEYSWKHARRLGKNAARLVKGLPLHLPERG
ncbi:glycerol dehydratase reactivase beta/small subunit family protein [Brevibacillus choshinensis]|uniref:Glycerol dehydratase reactivase beta/small subunit family protein n=1 Tax=Brevibacillus choshinensis TaxID=54911 RepID=A0ABX7FTV0_BRECH|nr:glycerol dehydratase reactivase beta/small subunit family protein [Brevibacillus choshinensis]QRG69225.1 glycerol dehydratase reactivase beta/small subunit family protein [Brevibacillus choshinensis]